MQTTMEMTAVGRNIVIRTKSAHRLAGAVSRSSLISILPLGDGMLGEAKYPALTQAGRPLLLRGKVALACPDLQVFLEGGDLDGAEAPVSFEICRMVGNHVLTPQLVFDGRERTLNVLHFEGKERTPAGRL